MFGSDLYSTDIITLATHVIMAIAAKLLAMFNTLSQVGSFFLVIVLSMVYLLRYYFYKLLLSAVVLITTGE